MDRDRLQSLLTELHHELGRADTLDAGLRQLLLRVMEDARLLAAEQAPEHEVDAGSVTAFQDAALELQSSYPQLSLLVGQIADTLAKLGI